MVRKRFAGSTSRRAKPTTTVDTSSRRRFAKPQKRVKLPTAAQLKAIADAKEKAKAEAAKAEAARKAANAPVTINGQEFSRTAYEKALSAVQKKASGKRISFGGEGEELIQLGITNEELRIGRGYFDSENTP